MLFTDDTIIYIENPKESTKNQNRTNKNIYQGCRIQSKYAKSTAFLYVINKQLEKNNINNRIRKSIATNQTKDA